MPLPPVPRPVARPGAAGPAETIGGFVLAACAASGIAATLLVTIRPEVGADAHGAALLLASLAPAMFTGFGYLVLPRALGAGTSVAPALARIAAWGVAAAAFAAVAACDGVREAKPAMAGLAWIGLGAAALDLTTTILVGRDRRIRLASLPPLAVASLASGLMLVMVLPVEAAIATRHALAPPAGLRQAALGPATTAPVIPLLLALGLGVAAEVADVRSAVVRGAIAAEAWLGCLVWVHLVFADRFPSPHGAAFAAWALAIAAPALVPIVPILRGAWRSLRAEPRDARTVALLHATAFALLVPIGLAQLASGSQGGHTALSLACLFAVFCGFCAWSEPPRGRLAVWHEAGLALQFAMLAAGTVAMLSAPLLPLAGRIGETSTALASVWFALIVIAGSLRPFARPSTRSRGIGA